LRALQGEIIVAISIGSAVGSGFNLIGRRPVSVISWGFFIYLTIFVLLGIGVAIVGLPVLARLVSLNGQRPAPTEAAQLVLQMFIALWPALLIVMIGSIFVSVMVQGAVFRSILEPDHKGFFSLRFGSAEGSLLLLLLLYIPIFVVVWLISAIIVGGLFLSAHYIHGLVGGLVAFLGCVAYGLAFMWIALRFSLAAPMTFAERRVRFLGSWALTKGEGWRLFGLAWLMVLVWFGVTLGYSIVSGIVNAVFTGGAMAAILASSSSSAGTPDPGVLVSHWPILVLAYIPSFILGAAFNGIIQAIAQGPWADVYRQLKGSPEVASTFA
jgi:hypothetical protein